MTEEERLRALVQWYSVQLAQATSALGQQTVENKALREQLDGAIGNSAETSG